MRTCITRLTLAGGLLLSLVSGAGAQGLGIKGYGLVGGMSFAASESFDAVLDTSSGTIVGGGAEIGLPWGGLYLGVGAWRFSGEGERVFVSGSEVFRLGIPLTIEVTPIEVTGGWRFKNISSRLVPYVGAGWSSYAYKETSDFADADEDVDDRFSGFHILGGAEFKLTRWLGLGGEFAWSRVPDALGAGGASQAFDETDLGGTSYRLKISVGR
jgi:Outer membrane protein beta-barrel domain